jgi:hypothetical protein
LAKADAKTLGQTFNTIRLNILLMQLPSSTTLTPFIFWSTVDLPAMLMEKIFSGRLS